METIELWKEHVLDLCQKGQDVISYFPEGKAKANNSPIGTMSGRVSLDKVESLRCTALFLLREKVRGMPQKVVNQARQDFEDGTWLCAARMGNTNAHWNVGRCKYFRSPEDQIKESSGKTE